MPRLFTVRWPFFARLDALLLFGIGLLIAARITLIRDFAEHTVAPALPAGLFRLGLSKDIVFWGEMVITGIIPYVLLLTVADRVLTIRKGYALLATIAVAACATAALLYSQSLAELFPSHIAGEVSFLATGRHAAYAACGVALLLHMRPLWIGARDHGAVATRLINRSARRPVGEAVDQFRERSDFRGWRPQHELEGAGGVPKESRGLRFVFGIAWVSVAFGVGVAYFHWGAWGSKGHEAGSSGAAPAVVTGAPSSGQSVMHPSTFVSLAEPRETSFAGSLPEMGQQSGSAFGPAIVTAQLPAVQRPTELAPGQDNGPNEAVAMRGRDGGFAFDAIINGARISMLFDTGASVVAIRAEEAERLGITLSNLNYSAKVKTANGVTEVAPVIINSITIGSITQRRVIGYVAREGTLPRNLLGQTFLAGLAGYSVENNRLVLRGH